MEMLGLELTSQERAKIIIKHIEPSKPNETIERVELLNDGQIVFYTSLLKGVKK